MIVDEPKDNRRNENNILHLKKKGREQWTDVSWGWNLISENAHGGAEGIMNAGRITSSQIWRLLSQLGMTQTQTNRKGKREDYIRRRRGMITNRSYPIWLCI